MTNKERALVEAATRVDVAMMTLSPVYTLLEDAGADDIKHLEAWSNVSRKLGEFSTQLRRVAAGGGVKR